MALQTISVVSVVDGQHRRPPMPAKVADAEVGLEAPGRSGRAGRRAGRRYGSTTQGSSNDGEEAAGSRSVTACSVGSLAVTVLQPPPDRDLDVVCIGNAIVDVIAPPTRRFLADHGLPKGSMKLIDAERAHRLYADMAPAVEIVGRLGGQHRGRHRRRSAGRPASSARCADDQLGEVFAHDIRAAGVDFDSAPRRPRGRPGHGPLPDPGHRPTPSAR